MVLVRPFHMTVAFTPAGRVRVRFLDWSMETAMGPWGGGDGAANPVQAEEVWGDGDFAVAGRGGPDAEDVFGEPGGGTGGPSVGERDEEAAGAIGLE